MLHRRCGSHKQSFHRFGVPGDGADIRRRIVDFEAAVRGTRVRGGGR